MFNPGFPWYLTTIRLVGATPVLVQLEGPDFAPDMAKVVNRLVLLLTPLGQFCCVFLHYYRGTVSIYAQYVIVSMDSHVRREKACFSVLVVLAWKVTDRTVLRQGVRLAVLNQSWCCLVALGEYFPPSFLRKI